MQDNLQTSENLAKHKPKAKYSTPVLVEYGRVADLTLGTISTRNDPGGALNGKS